MLLFHFVHHNGMAYLAPLSIGRGSNPRLKNNKWEIKDSELNTELKSGAVLLAYSSNDPTETVV